MDEATLYLEHERLVYSIAYQFCLRHRHLELEEIQREAVVFALEAIRTYTTNHVARLSTWISRVVRCGLIEKTRGNRWQRYAVQSWPIWNEDVPQNSDFDYRRFLFEISGDAASAIKIALGNNFTRGVLRQVLADLGWSKFRIQKTFEEVRESL